jgi:hypothetical protein
VTRPSNLRVALQIANASAQTEDTKLQLIQNQKRVENRLAKGADVTEAVTPPRNLQCPTPRASPRLRRPMSHQLLDSHHKIFIQENREQTAANTRNGRHEQICVPAYAGAQPLFNRNGSK